eukprot:CAMPEP_0206503486 /NCGR_PEP_ID=MMETSP0324_2-20121206/54756_1 /ASSEMBLY_ACC=CAM_ASM_000836 /TAXON_ID=2866 /ORGANISM="Crypthecodinium cohnii, Strain Seligo" /LENGTH=377 /DNA_ID=CAMNT_0053992149 /DNA_START=28 /DNA_END=1162 /DNA_ORIENTATION=+
MFASSLSRYAWASFKILSLLVFSTGHVTGTVTDVISGVAVVNYKIVKQVPHKTDCFSEGLFMDPDSHEMWESCGLTGKSYLRRYSFETGETLQMANVPKDLFSEGLVRFGQSLFMLTYHHNQVVEYDASTLAEIKRHPFTYGEGWGLTTDGCDLLATTGSAYIFRLRLVDGELTFVSKVKVQTSDGTAVRMLNEVEYVTPKLWVNKWLTNLIFRVDPITGLAEKQVSLKGLHSWKGEATPNGLAYSVDGLGGNHLLVTGKLWPQMFLLELSQEDLCGPSVDSEPSCPAAPKSACFLGARTEEVSNAKAADIEASTSSPPSVEAKAGQQEIVVPLITLPPLLSEAASVGAVTCACLAAFVSYRILQQRRQFKVVQADV